MTTIPTTDDMLGLAEAIVTQGFDAHRTALAELVEAARRRGVRPVLVDIVADEASPTVARLRALGRVIVALSAGPAARVDAARTLVSAAA